LVWDLERERVLSTFEPLAAHPALATLAAEGRQWVSVVNDRTVTYSAAQIEPRKSRRISSWTVQLATVRVRRTANGKELGSFPVPQNVRSAAASTDGRLLATLGNKNDQNEPTLMLWDLTAGRHLGELAEAEPRWELAFLPDHQTLLALGDRAMRLWKAPAPAAHGPQPLAEIRSSGDATAAVSALQFTPDGRQLLVVGKDGANVWALPGRQRVQHLGRYDDDAGHVLALAPGGESLVLVSGSAGERWLHSPRGWIWDGGSTLPPGRRLGRVGVGRQWRSADPPDQFLEFFWIGRSLVFSPDGAHLAVGLRTTELFHIAGEPPGTFAVVNWATGADVAVAGPTLTAIGLQDIGCLCYSPHGDRLAAAVGDRSEGATAIHLLDPHQNYAITRTFALPPRHRARCVAFTPDGRHLAAGGGKPTPWREPPSARPEDYCVVLWRTDAAEPVRTFTGHTAPVRALAFSADGQWLVTGGDDQTIRLWEVATGRLKLTVTGHQGPVTAVAFAPDGRILATGSEDTTVVLWDFTRLITQAR
jgi:WD40 repeat protein